MCGVIGGGVGMCVLDLISLSPWGGIVTAVCFQGVFKPMDLNRIIKLLEESDKVSNLGEVTLLYYLETRMSLSSNGHSL